MSNLEDPLLRRDSSISRVYPIKREELWYYLYTNSIFLALGLNPIILEKESV